MSNYGVTINGRRPKSKKEIKEAVANGATVRFENLSMFGGEDAVVRGGVLEPAKSVAFVGPDPHRDRKFYGTVEMRNGKVIVK
jgi:hypothetical protein